MHHTSNGSGIVILMGLPASGKTTLAKKLVDECPSGYSVIRWTLDEHPNKGTLRDKNDALFHQIQQALGQRAALPTIHIIDDTMHLDSMRRRYVALCKEFKMGVALVPLSAPIEELIKRNQLRKVLGEPGAALNDDVISTMARNFEPVRESMARFMVEPCNPMEKLWAGIIGKFEEAKEIFLQEEFSQLNVISESTVHEFDIFIRTVIHGVIESTESQKRRFVAEKLKSWKDQSIGDLKTQLVQGDPSPILDAFRQNSVCFANFC